MSTCERCGVERVNGKHPASPCLDALQRLVEKAAALASAEKQHSRNKKRQGDLFGGKAEVELVFGEIG